MAKLILKNVRCSYVFIDQPRKSIVNDQGEKVEGKYGVQILVPKTDKKTIAKIEATVKEVAGEKFGDRVKLTMLKLPLRDGDTDRDTDECAGMMFMNANSTRKPGIVNRLNQAVSKEDMEEMGFSGCYFHVSIDLYGFKVDGNKGVAVGLNNLMLRKVGKRLDGSSSAESDFEDEADDAGDDFGDEDGL